MIPEIPAELAEPDAPRVGPPAVVCCAREATEPEGAGHDVDCPGPGVIPDGLVRSRRNIGWRGPGAR